MHNSIDVAKLLYPSDNTTVLCSICKKPHIRQHGWAHKSHPVCEACGEDLLTLYNELFTEKEVKENGREM